MSLSNFIHNPSHHSMDISIHDGTFNRVKPAAPRCEPYLYLTIDGPAARQAISLPITADTAEQLRTLADKAEEYWESWQEFQHPEVEEEDIAPEPPLDFATALFEAFRPVPLTNEMAS